MDNKQLIIIVAAILGASIIISCGIYIGTGHLVPNVLDTSTNITLTPDNQMSVEQGVEYAKELPKVNNDTVKWLSEQSGKKLVYGDNAYYLMSQNDANKLPDTSSDIQATCNIVGTHSLGTAGKDIIEINNLKVIG